MFIFQGEGPALKKRRSSEEVQARAAKEVLNAHPEAAKEIQKQSLSTPQAQSYYLYKNYPEEYKKAFMDAGGNDTMWAAFEKEYQHYLELTSAKNQVERTVAMAGLPRGAIKRTQKAEQDANEFASESVRKSKNRPSGGTEFFSKRETT